MNKDREIWIDAVMLAAESDRRSSGLDAGELRATAEKLFDPLCADVTPSIEREGDHLSIAPWPHPESVLDKFFSV